LVEGTAELLSVSAFDILIKVEKDLLDLILSLFLGLWVSEEDSLMSSLHVALVKQVKDDLMLAAQVEHATILNLNAIDER
jgi:hypothetical protein